MAQQEVVLQDYPAHIKDMGEYIGCAVQNGTFFEKTTTNKTHIAKHVADKKESDVLDRVLKDSGNAQRHNRQPEKDKKNINSGFYSYDTACFVIEECMMNNKFEIAEWVDRARQGKQKSFDITLSKEDGQEPVGYGYVLDRETNTIAEYLTYSAKVVLEKNDEYALGFTTPTAYPDLTDEENRQMTGRDISQILKQTKTFQEASPTAKAYMLYQVNLNSPYLVTFKEGRNGNVHDDVMSIHMPYRTAKGEDCKQIIRIKEDSIELSTHRMSDVKIARRMLHGRPIETIIQADTKEELETAIQSFAKNGSEIHDGRRYVKIDSFYTRHFGTTNEKGKSVDLLRPDVFAAFRKRNPDAADIVLQSCDAMGLKRPDRYDKIKQPEKLNEGLSPRETTHEKTDEIGVV